MSNPRVYGTVVHDGLRHAASGVVDGTFAKTKGGWDTYTRCGKYVGGAVESDEDLVVDCLRCLGRRVPTVTLRQVHDEVMIDEAADYTPDELERLVDEMSRDIFTHGTAGTPSGPLPPSPARPRASRR